MTDERQERIRRAAKNQSMFRQVNEQLQNLASTFQFVANKSIFVCECADIGCTAQIEMRMEEYEAVRAHENRFIVLPGHELPNLENTVGTSEGFLLVEKIAEGAAIARATYPRA